MSEIDHEFCRYLLRDQAVRAAEDAAAVPSIQHRDLPEVVAALTERVAKIEEAMMSGSTWYPICDIPAPPPPPAPPQPAPAPPAEGLRTERVTLEVTQRVEDYVAPSRWNWCGQLGSHAQPGESVRVVDEADAASDEAVAHGATLSALADARESLAAANRGIARLTAERDAAIRERDAARARVAELEAAPPPRGWLTAEERAAVEEAMVDYASNVGDSDCERIERVLRALLAREMPPRVRRPDLNVLTITAEARDRMWFAAIRAAGGEVWG